MQGRIAARWSTIQAALDSAGPARVLLAFRDDAELYDPATNQWTLLSSTMARARDSRATRARQGLRQWRADAIPRLCVRARLPAGAFDRRRQEI